MNNTKEDDYVVANPEIDSPVPDNERTANRNELYVDDPEQTDKDDPPSNEDLQESEELEEPHDDDIGKCVEESESCHGCYVQYPPCPPVDNDYSRALDVHRAIFNREVFGTDFEEGSPKYVHLQRSRTISSERIDLIIRYLRAKEDDSILCEEMKNEHGTNVYD